MGRLVRKRFEVSGRWLIIVSIMEKWEVGNILVGCLG